MWPCLQNRVRVKEFLIDFDKLRSGFVYPNHFLTAMSMAGLDKVLTPTELQTICDTYTVPRSPSLIMTDYKTFLNDVEIVFTLPVGTCLCLSSPQAQQHAGCACTNCLKGIMSLLERSWAREGLAAGCRAS